MNSLCNTILIIEDDILNSQGFSAILNKAGYLTILAHTVSDAIQKIDKFGNEIDLITLDLLLPFGKITDDFNFDEIPNESLAGIFIFKYTREKYPKIPIIIRSATLDDSNLVFFENQKNIKILKKGGGTKQIVHLLDNIINKKSTIKSNVFIVHGHDNEVLFELKNYIQNVLKLGEPIVLHEKPNYGRSYFEKFENYAEEIDYVFVLLTPDDQVINNSQPTFRARQNVIFELGYFMGLLREHKGKVILLYKGYLEIPSNIHGLAYIDISNGILNAGELIRREIQIV